jgi:hypothetical protein
MPVSAMARARQRLRTIPATLSCSTTTVPCWVASVVVSLCNASRRRSAALAWTRASRRRVRFLRLEPGRRRASSRLSRRSLRNEPSRALGLAITVPVDSTARCRTPTSTPTTLGLPLPAGMARCTSTVNEMYQRSARRLMVAARMRAVPCSSRRASLRVDSWVLTTPMRGSWTCLRSASTRMAPVVKRQATRARRFLLRRGKPTGRPLRRPLRESLQFRSALASPSRPLL